MGKHAKITLPGFKVLKVAPGTSKSGDPFYSMDLVNSEGGDRIRAFCFNNSTAYVCMNLSLNGGGGIDNSLLFKKDGIYDFECEATFESFVVDGKFFQGIKMMKIKSYAPSQSANKATETKTEVKPIGSLSGFGRKEA